METAEVRVETLRVGDKISYHGMPTVVSIKINPAREGYKTGLVILKLKYPDGAKVKTLHPTGTYMQLNY